MKQSKKQILVASIFKQVKVLMNQYDDSYTKASDSWILDKIENSIVSGGCKGYGFIVACHYKKYTFYTCYGIEKFVSILALFLCQKIQ